MSTALNPVGNTPNCALTFRMPSLTPGAFVRCTGWGCTFGVNTSRATCSTVKCECPNGCSSEC